MKPSCYIIYSSNQDKFYIGATHKGVESRLFKHNSGYYGSKHFTCIANDWVVYLDICADNFSHALRMEKHIKRMRTRTYYQNLKRYPELRQKLINSTRI